MNLDAYGILEAIDSGFSKTQQGIEFLRSKPFTDFYNKFTRYPATLVAEKEKFLVYKDGKEIETTFGRYVRRHLEVTADIISDAKLVEMGNFVVERIMGASQSIKVVTGKDIWLTYRDRRYPHSCMTGGQSVPTMFYAKQPNISMVVFDDEDACARALLVTTDQGHIVRDRIYATKGYASSAVQNWTKEMGYNKKDDIDILNDTLTVLRTPPFPYMDTWRLGQSLGRKKIILHHHESGFRDYNYVFNGQYGGIVNRHNRMCTSTAKCKKCGKRRAHSRFQYFDIDDMVCLHCYRASRILCIKCFKYHSPEYGEKCDCKEPVTLVG